MFVLEVLDTLFTPGNIDMSGTTKTIFLYAVFHSRYFLGSVVKNTLAE